MIGQAGMKGVTSQTLNVSSTKFFVMQKRHCSHYRKINVVCLRFLARMNGTSFKGEEKVRMQMGMTVVAFCKGKDLKMFTFTW